jgi:hypothetical protein
VGYEGKILNKSKGNLNLIGFKLFLPQAKTLAGSKRII